jgi:hypothetical protein
MGAKHRGSTGQTPDFNDWTMVVLTTEAISGKMSGKKGRKPREQFQQTRISISGRFDQGSAAAVLLSDGIL